MFQRESDLVERLAALAQELFPGSDQVATEVAARAGIADLVIARADRERLALRARAGLDPVVLPGAAQLLVAMPEEESAPQPIFAQTAISADYGRRLLRALSGSGHVLSGDGRWRRVSAVRDAYAEIIAIEAKLDDWGRALMQAVRYRGYADYAYVALPSPRTDLVDRRQFAVAGVGLIGVDEDRAAIILPASRSTRIQRWRRLLVSEALAAQITSKKPAAMLPDPVSDSRVACGYPRGRLLPVH